MSIALYIIDNRLEQKEKSKNNSGTLAEGRSLLEYLQAGETQAVPAALEVLAAAHRLGEAFGDRWAGNTVITPYGMAMMVDFEVSAAGPGAAELDLAQLLYAICGCTTNFGALRPQLAGFVDAHRNEYDWNQVSRFVRGYEAYFSHDRIGRIMERAQHRLGSLLHQLDRLLVEH